MKPRIKSVIWNIKKQKTPNQNSKIMIIIITTTTTTIILKNEDSARILLDSFKHRKVYITGMPEGGKRKILKTNLKS